MIVGIFEASLIYSCAGNLRKVQVDQGVGPEAHFDSLCYSFYFRYYSRIEHTVIKYESLSSACLVCIPVRNATICSSYVKCKDQFLTTTTEC